MASNPFHERVNPKCVYSMVSQMQQKIEPALSSGTPQGPKAFELPLYVDSSMLSTWRACRRKFFWSTVHALYPTGKSVHLIAGGAFAAGMEAARKRVFNSSNPARCPFPDILDAAYLAFANTWGTYQPPENSTKTFSNTFSALREYLETFDPRTDAIQPALRPSGEPAVEFTFSIPMEVDHPSGVPFLFTGRFDLLGLYSGLPCVVDEKTTSSLGFAWDEQWNLRGQFLGYVWACQQLGWDINTAIIRGIAIQKKEVKFATAIKQYPQFLIEKWHQQTLMDLRAIREAWLHWRQETSEDEVFGYNFADACSSYGGCAFLQLCTQRDAEPFFSNYIRHRWDPLAKQPVKEITS